MRYDTLTFKMGLRSIADHQSIAQEIENERKRRLEDMALMVISKAKIPATARGAVGSFSISVRENGQIGFSTAVAKLFDGAKHTAIAWDADSRTMVFTPVADPASPPKGYKTEQLFDVGQSKSKDGKGGLRYISAAGLFKLDGISYDYKSAGTHTFDAVKNEKTGAVSFVLPERMDPKPKAPRKPKAAKVAAGATASAPAAENEPELQEA